VCGINLESNAEKNHDKQDFFSGYAFEEKRAVRTKKLRVISM
jgi:hypothetical protein